MNRSDLPTLPAFPTDLPNWPLELIEQRLSPDFHGDFTKWQQAIAQLPDNLAVTVSPGDTVHLELQTDVDLVPPLRALMPWRKGPFQFGDVFIDSEWRSDWKWQRLADQIDLVGQRVLDVGCGNGYFGWRMLQAGAREVVGVDPTLLFCMQHRAVQHFARDHHNWVLPLGIEELPQQPLFDAVFSMGVIYHRRDPQAHVVELKNHLRTGGQLLLESIVSPGERGFKPQNRYARMRNVWWIPTVAELTQWLAAAGLSDIQCLEVCKTTVQEQRSTPWMTFESLADCLDPEAPDKTVEGYPAPQRAVMLAHL